MFVPFFGMFGKQRPITIPWYQVSIPQAFVFQVHRGATTTPFVIRRVTNNSLVGRGANELLHLKSIQPLWKIWKVYHVIFRLYLPQKKEMFHSEVSNELIYLEFASPWKGCFLNLPQGMCGIQMELLLKNRYIKKMLWTRAETS